VISTNCFKMGVYAGSGRTQDQSDLALFWAGNTPLYWNRIAAQLSVERGCHFTRMHTCCVVECHDGRPPQSRVGMASTATSSGGRLPRSGTGSLLRIRTQPGYPGWTSSGRDSCASRVSLGHSTVSGSAAFILAARFGENTALALPRKQLPEDSLFANFSDAVGEIANARVFGGIHFRTSCVRANLLGRSVADYVSRPLCGQLETTTN